MFFTLYTRAHANSFAGTFLQSQTHTVRDAAPNRILPSHPLAAVLIQQIPACLVSSLYSESFLEWNLDDLSNQGESKLGRLSRLSRLGRVQKTMMQSLTSVLYVIRRME